jgi:hypothetical protein
MYEVKSASSDAVGGKAAQLFQLFNVAQKWCTPLHGDCPQVVAKERILIFFVNLFSFATALSCFFSFSSALSMVQWVYRTVLREIYCC